VPIIRTKRLRCIDLQKMFLAHQLHYELKVYLIEFSSFGSSKVSFCIRRSSQLAVVILPHVIGEWEGPETQWPSDVEF